MTGQGSILYMLGALTTVGKLGMIAIDHDPESADARYKQTLEFIGEHSPRP